MNKKQVLVLFIIFVSMITITVCSIKFYHTYNTPTLVLTGEKTITINLYEKYNEMGAKAYINDKKISDKIEIEDNIDENKPGNYKVTYSLKNSKIERNVIVKDNIAPVITLNGNEKTKIYLNTEYKEEGAKATDNIDGDLTNVIEISGEVDTKKEGTYYKIYSVKDKEGNIATVERQIVVEKKPEVVTPPKETPTDPTTYVKISIEKQTIEVYKNNELVITSPVVTGTENYTESDKGIFKIYSKSKNTYLKGVGYLSYVNYWMPYNRGEGLHDATWRQEFGGEIYKTNGSHGCINMPLDIAEKVYNTVNVGTTVEVY